MDSFVFTEVNFIKIGIDGFEPQVVEDAREILLINRPIICGENKDKDVRNFETESKGDLSYLLELGMSTWSEICGYCILAKSN